MFKVEIDSAPARHLAAIFHRGDYRNIGACYERLATIANTNNLWPQIHGMIGIHYDDPNVVETDDLRAHAALWLADGTEIPDGLEQISLPTSDCAILHYKGPYTDIKPAYDYFYGDWLPKSGKEATDAPPYEVYLNSPNDTPESELLTDIVMPLAS